MSLPWVLVIAGLDPSGGAGLLRDVRTVESLGLRAFAAAAALTVQDAGRFEGFRAVDADLLRAQVAAGLRQGPSAIKIGMLGSRANVEALAGLLEDGAAAGVPVVLDPVLAASAGGALLDADAAGPLRDRLLPRATVVTPNLPEVEALAGRPARDRDGAIAAARALAARGPAVVLKGGHGAGDVVADLVVEGDRVTTLERPRRRGGIHGSGCRFSSALAAHLARGRTLVEAARLAGEAVAGEIGRGA